MRPSERLTITVAGEASMINSFASKALYYRWIDMRLFLIASMILYSIVIHRRDKNQERLPLGVVTLYAWTKLKDIEKLWLRRQAEYLRKILLRQILKG